MNPREQSLDRLVELYTDTPGAAESARLEYKAKEKVERTDGKRDVAKVASAIANSGGGTIVVGVGEGSRGDIIQSFDARSEIRRDLAHVFRDLTYPPLDRLTESSFERLSSGPRLLRIDVEPATTHPIEFRAPDMDELVPYHRVEDTTRRMGTTDIVEFSERNQSPANPGNSGVKASFSANREELQVFDESKQRVAPTNRAVLEIDRRGLVIPGQPLVNNPYRKSLTFHLETRGDDSGLSGLADLLERAEQDLEASLGFDFGYGIKYGSQELIGRTAGSYLDDLRQLEETLQLLGWEGESDPRPIAIGATRCNYGRLWVQIQYHTGSFSRLKCGLQMSDIPLQTNPLTDIFGDTWFSQDNGVQELRLRLRGDEIPLANPREALLAEGGREARTEIIADNPYFGNSRRLLEVAENLPPETFIEMLCSVDRLPYDVRGGYRSDDTYHTVGELELGYIDAIVPTYVVWPMCDPHPEAPDEEPPEPEWIKALKQDADDGDSE